MISKSIERADMRLMSLSVDEGSISFLFSRLVVWQLFFLFLDWVIFLFYFDGHVVNSTHSNNIFIVNSPAIKVRDLLPLLNFNWSRQKIHCTSAVVRSDATREDRKFNGLAKSQRSSATLKAASPKSLNNTKSRLKPETPLFSQKSNQPTWTSS